MRVIVCGAGTTGRHVAEALSEVHDVTVVERSSVRRVEGSPRLRCLIGDAADPETLMRAGARDADVVIAVTHEDATNLLICLIAKRALGVRWTVARINEPAHRWLSVPAAGVDVVVSSPELVARLVQEEITAGDLVTLLRLRGPGVAVTETTLPPGAAVAGTRAADLRLPEGVALTAVVRGEDLLLPDRAGALRAGDVVVALCEPGREHVLHDLLAGPAPE